MRYTALKKLNDGIMEDFEMGRMWQQILEFTGVIPEYLTECVYSRYDNV